MKTEIFNRKERKEHKGETNTTLDLPTDASVPTLPSPPRSGRGAGGEVSAPHSALRTPHSALVFVLFALFAVQSAPAQTNNLPPGTCAVMVTTNGVLAAPTNFFATNAALLNAVITNGGGNATNLTGVVAPAHGGLGYANTNLVPSGAHYDDGSTYSVPAYVINVVSNQTYFAVVTNLGGNEFIVNSTNWPSFLPQIGSDGAFITVTNKLLLLSLGNPGDPVTTQVWPAAPHLYGSLGGTWDGGQDSIPDSALTANVQLLSSPLNDSAIGGAEHKLYSTATGNGSTLSLIRYGTNGYADVNFFTAPNLSAAQSSPTLHGAIGVATTTGPAQFPYAQMYFESYGNAYDWYWVGANQIFGGFRSAGSGGVSSKGNFVWFQDGTTNTPMFEIDRTAKTITNYYPVVCVSNLTFNTSGKGITAPLYTPASSAETNNVGAIRWDANYLYLWTATNLNKRVALSTW